MICPIKRRAVLALCGSALAGAPAAAQTLRFRSLEAAEWAAFRTRFREAGIGLDVMQTGAAARTYNILLAENRKVGAALIAVP